MVRYAAAVEYDGSRYAGWQRQKHADSVQGCIEQALSQVANHPVEVVCAGRTDAGVHALGQIIHFDSYSEREAKGWLFGANALLPEDISLRWVQTVEPDFHARFSALGRCYRYLIHDHPARSGLMHGRVAWSRYRLDAKCMHEAGQVLLGEQDFSSFRAAECQSHTPMRCVTRLEVFRSGALLALEIEANAFLHHMVRNIAGALMAVGSGQQPQAWVRQVLDARDRKAGGVTAPPQGLYFLHVRYAPEWQLPDTGINDIFLQPWQG